MNEVDALDESRRRMLWVSLVGFALWQGLDLAGGVVELAGGSPALRHVAKVAGLLGAVVWGVGLFWMRRLMRRMKTQPSVAAALDDELVRHARMRSFARAFWAVLGAQVIVLLADGFHPVPLKLGVQFTILAGVTVAQAGFLRDRETPADA